MIADLNPSKQFHTLQPPVQYKVDCGAKSGLNKALHERSRAQFSTVYILYSQLQCCKSHYIVLCIFIAALHTKKAVFIKFLSVWVLCIVQQQSLSCPVKANEAGWWAKKVLCCTAVRTVPPYGALQSTRPSVIPGAHSLASLATTGRIWSPPITKFPKEQSSGDFLHDSPAMKQRSRQWISWHIGKLSLQHLLAVA